MKRFLEWWRGRPHLLVHFVEPGKETNPLAEQAIECLQQATKSLEHAVGLVNELQTQLTSVRSELIAHAVSCMDAERSDCRVRADAPERDAPKGRMTVGRGWPERSREERRIGLAARPSPEGVAKMPPLPNYVGNGVQSMPDPSKPS
jgi:hypothetical protein